MGNNNVKRGPYIALEGGEGSGKSTISTIIKEYLSTTLNYCVAPTREPGGTSLAEDLRRLILTNRDDGTQPSALTEAFIMNAARRDLLEKVVVPELNKGNLVFSDRCYLSTLVYQCHAGNVDLNIMTEITKVATIGAIQDVIIVLDIDPKVGLARSFSAASTGAATRMEEKGLIFHQQVRQGYLSEASKSENILVVNANQSIKDIFKEIIIALDKRNIIKHSGSINTNLECFWGNAITYAKNAHLLRECDDIKLPVYNLFTSLIVELLRKKLI